MFLCALTVQYYILQGLRFFATPSVKPDISVLRQIIESAGGTLVSRCPSTRTVAGLRTEQVSAAFKMKGYPY